jgi:hypothetical protein
VTFGKLDTTGADRNEFAHGKGDIQFFNTAFSFNLIALIAPYSTLGAGVIVLPTADINQAIVTLTTVSASGKSSTAGFDDLTGPLFGGEAQVRTDFFEVTGHQLIGGVYSWKDYTSVDQRLGFVIENRSLVRVHRTWSAYYNFDQYISPTKIGIRASVCLVGSAPRREIQFRRNTSTASVCGGQGTHRKLSVRSVRHRLLLREHQQSRPPGALHDPGILARRVGLRSILQSSRSHGGCT